MTVLPTSLKEAIKSGAFAVLATHRVGGSIQNHLMWVDYKDENLVINTEQGRKKTENVRDNTNVSILIFHPENMYRSWEIRGEVFSIKEGLEANDHIDELSMRYMGKPYRREIGVKWDSSEIKDRELWLIKPSTLSSMESRGAQVTSE